MSLTDPTQMIALTALVFLLAGTLKGVVGIGLPMTTIGVLTLAIDPRTAIALTLLPMVTSNALQVARSGRVKATIRRYTPFAIPLAVTVWVTIALTRNAPDQILFAILGVSILIFVLASILSQIPQIPDRMDTQMQVGAGVLAGILGGLTSVWAAPMILYLTARRAPKDEFVRATGFLITVGSVPLIAGYLRQGFLPAELALQSTLLIAPTFAGFWVGEKLRGALSEAAFRRFLLFVFCMMALNLLRKSMTG